MNFSADFGSRRAISLISAPPIMLFGLSPASTRARIWRSDASVSSPWRTAWMASDPRIFSGPALQIVRRTTPRESRSMPQWGLSICRAPPHDLKKYDPQFPDNGLSCQDRLRRDLRAVGCAFSKRQEAKIETVVPNKMQHFASADVKRMLPSLYDLKHIMGFRCGIPKN